MGKFGRNYNNDVGDLSWYGDGKKENRQSVEVVSRSDYRQMSSRYESKQEGYWTTSRYSLPVKILLSPIWLVANVVGLVFAFFVAILMGFVGTWIVPLLIFGILSVFSVLTTGDFVSIFGDIANTAIWSWIISAFLLGIVKFASAVFEASRKY